MRKGSEIFGKKLSRKRKWQAKRGSSGGTAVAGRGFPLEDLRGRLSTSALPLASKNSERRGGKNRHVRRLSKRGGGKTQGEVFLRLQGARTYGEGYHLTVNDGCGEKNTKEVGPASRGRSASHQTEFKGTGRPARSWDREKISPRC